MGQSLRHKSSGMLSVKSKVEEKHSSFIVVEGNSTPVPALPAASLNTRYQPRSSWNFMPLNVKRRNTNPRRAS